MSLFHGWNFLTGKVGMDSSLASQSNERIKPSIATGILVSLALDTDRTRVYLGREVGIQVNELVGRDSVLTSITSCINPTG